MQIKISYIGRYFQKLGDNWEYAELVCATADREAVIDVLFDGGFEYVIGRSDDKETLMYVPIHDDNGEEAYKRFLYWWRIGMERTGKQLVYTVN